MVGWKDDIRLMWCEREREPTSIRLDKRVVGIAEPGFLSTVYKDDRGGGITMQAKYSSSSYNTAGKGETQVIVIR